jgi:hypothetical protein
VDEQKEAGDYQARWIASNVLTGIYFYCLEGGDVTETKEITCCVRYLSVRFT